MIRQKKNKTICAISDTHQKEVWLDVPECAILIFAGDFGITSLNDLEYANRWFAKQKANHKIFVAGNHDTYLEHLGKEKTKEFFTNVIYLENEYVEINDLKIYGSPYTPYFNGWAFSYQRCSLEAKQNWSKIPENLDILITHGPSWGILDRNLYDARCGCSSLLREIDKKRPRRHVFGHIHGWGGKCINQNGIDFYNCSVLNEKYDLTNKPTIINP